MKWLLLLAGLPVILLIGGLLLNRPPLMTPPGPWERISLYLTTNVAETRPDHALPELRTPRLNGEPAQIHEAVLSAMGKLAWQEIKQEGGTTEAVAVSPLFRFRDDVSVRLETIDGGTLLHARSASRVGRGDFAANARHLQDLFKHLEGMTR